MTVSYNIPGLSKQTWPLETSDQSHIIATYGKPWQDQSLLTTVPIPWKANASHIEIHKHCADSLTRILAAIWARAGHDQSVINAAHLNYFSGSYVDRDNVNDKSRKSMHAFGIATDWADPWNPNGVKWHDGGSMLPQWVADCFLAEGWMWLRGKYGTADAMHFQATENTYPDAPADGPAPPSPPDTPEPVLQVGASGPEVLRLQQALGVPPTGIFDDGVTLQAVLSLQMNNGLTADGIVGKATWAVVDAQKPPAPIPQPAPVPAPGPQPPAPPAPPVTPVSADAFIQALRKFLLDVCGVTSQIESAKTQLKALIDKQAAELRADIDTLLDLDVGQVVITPPAPPTPVPAPPPPIIVVPPKPPKPLSAGAQIYQKLLTKFQASSVVGVAPSDGAQFGITTGTADQWARFATACCDAESGFNPRAANTSDPGGSYGIFQYAHSQVPGYDPHTNPDAAYDVDASVSAFVRDAESSAKFGSLQLGILGRRFSTIGRHPDRTIAKLGVAAKLAAEASQQKGQAMPPVVNNVPIGTPALSKINLTSAAQIIGVGAVLLTNLSGGKYNLDASTQAAIVSGIAIVGPMLQVIWRTWFTTKIMPQSLPPSPT